MTAVNRRILALVILAPAVLVLGRQFLRWFERANLYFPDHGFSIIPETFRMRYEDVHLATEDGVRLFGWYLPPPEEGPLSGKKLVLVYCHGNAGNISNRVPKAAIFRKLGLGVLLFDYRGYGKSEGAPSEQGTYLDAAAAVRWLTEVKKVPADRIVLYGESLGCAVAVETALHLAARALVLESPFTSTIDMGKEVFPWLPVKWLVTFRYDNAAKLPSLRLPLLVMHSREDNIVPFRMGRALYEAAPGPKDFLEMSGDHDEGYLDTGEAYPKALRAFLEKT